MLRLTGKHWARCRKSCGKEGEGEKDLDVTGASQEDQQRQLTRAKRGLLILKHQPRTLHGLDLDIADRRLRPHVGPLVRGEGAVSYMDFLVSFSSTSPWKDYLARPQGKRTRSALM